MLRPRGTSAMSTSQESSDIICFTISRFTQSSWRKDSIGWFTSPLLYDLFRSLFMDNASFVVAFEKARDWWVMMVGIGWWVEAIVRWWARHYLRWARHYNTTQWITTIQHSESLQYNTPRHYNTTQHSEAYLRNNSNFIYPWMLFSRAFLLLVFDPFCF